MCLDETPEAKCVRLRVAEKGTVTADSTNVRLGQITDELWIEADKKGENLDWDDLLFWLFDLRDSIRAKKC